jgi:hypothetical protein
MAPLSTPSPICSRAACTSSSSGTASGDDITGQPPARAHDAGFSPWPRQQPAAASTRTAGHSARI